MLVVDALYVQCHGRKCVGLLAEAIYQLFNAKKNPVYHCYVPYVSHV